MHSPGQTVCQESAGAQSWVVTQASPAFILGPPRQRIVLAHGQLVLLFLQDLPLPTWRLVHLVVGEPGRLILLTEELLTVLRVQLPGPDAQTHGQEEELVLLGVPVAHPSPQHPPAGPRSSRPRYGPRTPPNGAAGRGSGPGRGWPEGRTRASRRPGSSGPGTRVPAATASACYTYASQSLFRVAGACPRSVPEALSSVSFQATTLPGNPKYTAACQRRGGVAATLVPEQRA